MSRNRKIFMAMIFAEKSIHFGCHSGLDRACPVLDTGESRAFNLDSCWSLPRTSIRGRNDGLGIGAKKPWWHHTITFVTIFVLVGYVLTIPAEATGQTGEKTALSQQSGRDPFLLPPGVHLLSKTGATSGRTAIPSKSISASLFVLSAILVTEHARLALIDRHIVTVGDSIHGEKVLEIKTDRVVLEKGEQKRTLLLTQSPIRLLVEQSPLRNPPAKKEGQTLLEIPAAGPSLPEEPNPPAEQGSLISNDAKEEVEGEHR